MTEPPEPIAPAPHGKPRLHPATVGSALELAAMVLVSAAGFAAPTDWNVTLGLALLSGCLFALGFFALTDDKPTTKPTTVKGA